MTGPTARLKIDRAKLFDNIISRARNGIGTGLAALAVHEFSLALTDKCY